MAKTKAQKEAEAAAKAAAKRKKSKAEANAGKFLDSASARKAADKLAGDEDWADGMEHEESTAHHKAINRGC